MIEYNRDKAIIAIGGNQFELALISAERARQLRNGSEPKIQTEQSADITALIEVQEGLYTKKDYISDLQKRK